MLGRSRAVLGDAQGSTEAFRRAPESGARRCARGGRARRGLDGDGRRHRHARGQGPVRQAGADRAARSQGRVLSRLGGLPGGPASAGPGPLAPAAGRQPGRRAVAAAGDRGHPGGGPAARHRSGHGGGGRAGRAGTRAPVDGPAAQCRGHGQRRRHGARGPHGDDPGHGREAAGPHGRGRQRRRGLAPSGPVALGPGRGATGPRRPTSRRWPSIPTSRRCSRAMPSCWSARRRARRACRRSTTGPTSS